MSKTKILNLCSLILNVILVGLVGYGTVYLTIATSSLLGTLNYFTTLSNLFVGLTAICTIVANVIGLVKDRKLPKFIFVLDLLAAVNLIVTMLTVIAFLGPVVLQDYNMVLGLTNPMQNPQFFMHLVIPAFAILVFIFTNIREKVKFPWILLSLLGLVAYGGFYVLNYFMKFIQVNMTVRGQEFTTPDWYFFFEGFKALGMSEVIGYGVIGGLLLVGFLFALLFWALNGALNKAYFKNETATPSAAVEEASSNYSSSLEEKKEEPAPAPVEEKEPEPEEEPEPEPAPAPVEEAPKEEKKPAEKKPAPKKEEKKPAPKKEAKPEPKKEEKRAEPVKKAEPKKEAKPAPAKKAEAKPAPKKEEKKPAPAKKPEPKKEAKAESKDSNTKVYHLTKRKEDGMWAITFVGGQKAVKLFKTKKEAEAALAVLTENQGATALIRNSKGAKAGKFASSIKSDKD